MSINNIRIVHTSNENFDQSDVLFIYNQQSKINSFTPEMGTQIQKCCAGQSKQQAYPECNLKKVLCKDKRVQFRRKYDVSHSDCISSKGETTIDMTKDDQEKKDGKTKKIRSLSKIQEITMKLNFDDFQIDGVLGSGAYGTVYLGKLRKNKNHGIQDKLAIKCVYKQLLRKKDALEQAKYEKQIALSNNSFIVSLLMSFQDDFRIYFVMQYAEGGDTYSLIKGETQKVDEFKSLGQNGIRFMAACIILGLQFLHSQGYMYRDLKPQNVMLFGNGYIKLTDFGLAYKCDKGERCRIIKGTPLYLAPQMVLKKGYDKMIDFWALGIYLFEMSTLSIPFLPSQITENRFEKAYQQFKQDKRWFNNQISSQLKDLIHGLIKFNPQQRLGSKGFQQLKSHNFFDGFDWTLLKEHKMESPLKHLAKKFPVRAEKTKKQNVQIPLSSKSCENLKKVDGWSYYGNYADDI